MRGVALTIPFQWGWQPACTCCKDNYMFLLPTNSVFFHTLHYLLIDLFILYSYFSSPEHWHHTGQFQNGKQREEVK